MLYKGFGDALRATVRRLCAPVAWIALATVGVVLAIAAPFDTDSMMGLGARLLYWPFVAVTTYALGCFVDFWLEAPLCARIGRRAALLIVAALTGVTITAYMFGLNGALFGTWIAPDMALAMVLGIFSIAVIITVAHDAIEEYVAELQTGKTTKAPPTLKDDAPQAAPPADDTPEANAPAAPPLLDRLPEDLRAPLIAISVQNHHVVVRTTKGEDILLMRLSDAIREVGTTPGAQVHRSHWAAFDQVAGASRSGDRAVLTMKDGSEVPVSRARIALVKDAGLLH